MPIKTDKNPKIGERITRAIPVGIAFYYLRNRVIRVSTEINAISENLFERFRSKN